MYLPFRFNEVWLKISVIFLTDHCVFKHFGIRVSRSQAIICTRVASHVSWWLLSSNYLEYDLHCWKTWHYTHVISSRSVIKHKNCRKISNIRRTKSPNLNVSRLVLQLSLPNPMKPDVRSRMKMQLEQRRQAMLQLHLSDRQFYCPLRYDLY